MDFAEDRPSMDLNLSNMSPDSGLPTSSPPSFISPNNPSSSSSTNASPESSQRNAPQKISGFVRSRPQARDAEDVANSTKFNKLGLASRYINQIESNSKKPPEKPKRTRHTENSETQPNNDEIPKPRNRRKSKSNFSIFHQLPTVPPSPSRTPEEPPYQHHPNSPALLPSPEFLKHDYRHPTTSPDVLLEEVVSVKSSHYTGSIPEVEEIKETMIEKFLRVILNNEERLFDITYRMRQKQRRTVRHMGPERDAESCCGCFCIWLDKWRWNFWRLFYFIYDFFDQADSKRRNKWRESRAAVQMIY